jgi:hypothetical protein
MEPKTIMGAVEESEMIDLFMGVSYYYKHENGRYDEFKNIHHLQLRKGSTIRSWFTIENLKQTKIGDLNNIANISYYDQSLDTKIYTSLDYLVVSTKIFSHFYVELKKLIIYATKQISEDEIDQCNKSLKKFSDEKM